MDNEKLVEAMARAIWPLIQDEVTFDEAKKANDAGYCWVIELAKAIHDKALAEAGMVVVPREAVDLLRRYRRETPPGHSPHMICHKADKVLAMLAAHEGGA